VGDQLPELVEVVHRGGLNAHGRGRGARKVNTFRARWTPKPLKPPHQPPASSRPSGPSTGQTVRTASP
jgi:hypothetical protein